MKLTIDTQVDSYENIKKMLHLFMSVVEKGEVASLSTPTGEKVDSTSMMSMFDAPAKETPATPPDFSNFMNILNKTPEKKTDSSLSRVQLY